MRLGQQEAFLRELAADGEEIPELETIVTLDDISEPLFTAFHFLYKRRINGCISLSEMNAYMDIFGIQDRRNFALSLEIIDNAFLNMTAKPNDPSDHAED